VVRLKIKDLRELPMESFQRSVLSLRSCGSIHTDRRGRIGQAVSGEQSALGVLAVGS
jgi:hypothetical protein